MAVVNLTCLIEFIQNICKFCLLHQLHNPSFTVLQINMDISVDTVVSPNSAELRQNLHLRPRNTPDTGLCLHSL